MGTPPYANWIKLALIVLVLGGVSIGSWTLAVQTTNANWVNKQNEIAAKQSAQVKLLNASIAKLEENARVEQQKRTEDYLKGVTDGRSQTEAIIADLRSTNGGLWLKVHSANDRATGAENSAIQSKRDAAKAAQLTAEASEALIRISADGDESIRQLGLCQGEYQSLWNFTDAVVKKYNAYRFGTGGK